MLDGHDETYMLRALELAERGLGFVNPNPLVGCVLVRDGRIVTLNVEAQGEVNVSDAATMLAQLKANPKA